MAKAKSKTKWRARELQTFWYWMNERMRIYHKKKANAKWPWTKDKILQEYKFTNVYRQLDRVTEAWTHKFMALLHHGKGMSDGDLLFHCAMFRLFNLPATYDALHYGLNRWNRDKAVALLTKRKDEDFEQIFTGAYIIPNGGREDPKIEVICDALEFLYDGRTKKQKARRDLPNRDRLAKEIREDPSMERTVNILMQVPTIGAFIGYEIACDLRHTRLLSDARDINSWANPGPGAKRGLNRLLYGKAKVHGKKPDYIKLMRELLLMSQGKNSLEPHVRKGVEWPFEMREIEHSLCEFDKYLRVKHGEGKPRSRYRYKDPEAVPWASETED